MGLEVKVAEHRVRLPAPDESNDGGVNPFIEKGHRSCRTEGLDVDLGCGDAGGIAECDASLAQERGDGLWSEPDEPGWVFS